MHLYLSPFYALLVLSSFLPYVCSFVFVCVHMHGCWGLNPQPHCLHLWSELSDSRDTLCCACPCLFSPHSGGRWWENNAMTVPGSSWSSTLVSVVGQISGHHREGTFCKMCLKAECISLQIQCSWHPQIFLLSFWNLREIQEVSIRLLLVRGKTRLGTQVFDLEMRAFF